IADVNGDAAAGRPGGTSTEWPARGATDGRAEDASLDLRDCQQLALDLAHDRIVRRQRSARGHPGGYGKAALIGVRKEVDTDSPGDQQIDTEHECGCRHS